MGDSDNDKVSSGELLQSVVMAAIGNLMDAGSLPQDGSVSSSSARFAVLLIGEYIKTDSPISMAVAEVIESLRNSKDDIVKGLGIINRQLVWTALSNLSRQKEAFNASQAKIKASQGQLNADTGSADQA